MIGTLARWDGLYFIDIARNGYKNLKTHAFFPGFPLLVKFVETGVSKIDTIFGLHQFLGLSEIEVLVLTGVTMNIILHG